MQYIFEVNDLSPSTLHYVLHHLLGKMQYVGQMCQQVNSTPYR